MFRYQCEVPQKIYKAYKNRNLVESKRLYSGEVNSNKIHYFKGDVLSELDALEFKNILENKFDLIFSDALHQPDAV